MSANNIVSNEIFQSNGKTIVLWRWDGQWDTAQGGVAYTTVGSIIDQANGRVVNYPVDGKAITHKALVATNG